MRIKNLSLGSMAVSTAVAAALLAGCGPRPADTTTPAKSAPEKAASGVQSALIEEAPETYFRPPYVGVAGWVGVELSRVDDEQLGALIREAFLFVTPKIIAKGKKASARPT